MISIWQCLCHVLKWGEDAGLKQCRSGYQFFVYHVMKENNEVLQLLSQNCCLPLPELKNKIMVECHDSEAASVISC
ncbi:hypothetical protein QQP08_023554 [Theobroma cacao]|nr:hypothetical protein QQP08_023554 [Theobroma cacao]